MAALFRGVMGKLIEEYRQAPVRHADETGWRENGVNRYVWVFCSLTERVFAFGRRTKEMVDAVLGMAFDVSLAGALFDERDDVDAGVWRRLGAFVEDQGGGRYRFQHALMRDAAYEGLPYRRRKELHARVGNAILASTPAVPNAVGTTRSTPAMRASAWASSMVR